VRRAGVTTALHLLESEHVIRSTRGVVVVRDRPRLTKIAGASYGVAEAAYAQLVERKAPTARESTSGEQSALH
jgi:glycine/D-amino acid oxidase-like deaminating enzyme